MSPPTPVTHPTGPGRKPTDAIPECTHRIGRDTGRGREPTDAVR